MLIICEFHEDSYREVGIFLKDIKEIPLLPVIVYFQSKERLAERFVSSIISFRRTNFCCTDISGAVILAAFRVGVSLATHSPPINS
jgi:hypothetical protein